MKITIFRTYGKNGTYGNLVAKKNGNVVFMTNSIELPWRDNKRRVSCIPEGNYKCVPHKSPHLGRTFHVIDVPGRDGILIHVANYVAGKKIDLLGCIAPVSYIKDINGDTFLDGVHSGEVLNVLLQLFPNGFDLEIKKSQDA